MTKLIMQKVIEMNRELNVVKKMKELTTIEIVEVVEVKMEVPNVRESRTIRKTIEVKKITAKGMLIGTRMLMKRKTGEEEGRKALKVVMMEKVKINLQKGKKLKEIKVKRKKQKKPTVVKIQVNHPVQKNLRKRIKRKETKIVMTR